LPSQSPQARHPGAQNAHSRRQLGTEMPNHE
jgi:hypothetical protein